MGTRVRIASGRYARRAETVEANVAQRTVDCPEEFVVGFQVILDAGKVVAVRWGLLMPTTAAGTQRIRPIREKSLVGPTTRRP